MGNFFFTLGLTIFAPCATLWIWQLQRRIDRLENLIK